MDDGSLLMVVRGNATPEELAALVTVVTARVSSAGPSAPPAPPPGWADRSRSVRRPLVPGSGAWRTGTWAR
ncbi:acyl-CoA carboxylase subunit epsilon [Streptosporangium sp. CA-135522]|uniref:acyl-CoA carboxylase subunit epsilon n=1 Tax=Streptosporangium sp. CA-135522 TaxID=3240072 RepID=UPI003D8A1D4A